MTFVQSILLRSAKNNSSLKFLYDLDVMLFYSLQTLSLSLLISNNEWSLSPESTTLQSLAFMLLERTRSIIVEEVLVTRVGLVTCCVNTLDLHRSIFFDIIINIEIIHDEDLRILWQFINAIR